jgi:putative NADH-flavin reductase
MTMRLTIFGATGATGQHLVDQGLAAGHQVTAVVRDPKRLKVPSEKRLHILTADVMDPAAVIPAVEDADAVVSALGPRGRQSRSVSADSALSIVQAMEKSGASRLITVSGSIVDDTGNGIVMRAVIKPLARRTFLRHVCADMVRAERVVRTSNLDWTVVRPPRLTGQAGSGRYRVGEERNVPRGVVIARADLATYILTILDDPRTYWKQFFVAK